MHPLLVGHKSQIGENHEAGKEARKTVDSRGHDAVPNSKIYKNDCNFSKLNALPQAVVVKSIVAGVR